MARPDTSSHDGIAVGRWIDITHGFASILSAMRRFDEFVDNLFTCFIVCLTGPGPGTYRLGWNGYVVSVYLV
jgi:hypothetical protein